MQVHECMVVNPVTISPKATSAEALRLLRLKKLHALPVVDKEGQLVGIITEKDLLGLLPVAVLPVYITSYLFTAIAIEEAMTRRVITVPADYPLEEAARILIDNKIGRLPVMRGHQLVGIIAESDIFRAMMNVLGGCEDGLRITIRLLEDKGELGAVTDGIVQLGGKLVSLSTFWGHNPLKRKLTLKVQGINREELLLMLERTIGVQVIDFWESSAEAKPGAIRPIANTEAIPIPNLNAKIPWPLEPK